MTIHIEDLTFDVIIGLLDFERDKPQRVIVDCIINYTYEKKQFIDYAEVVLLIESQLKRERYTLLEEALEGVQEDIICTYPHIETLSLKIAKPDIIPSCTVALSKIWDFKN